MHWISRQRALGRADDVLRALPDLRGRVINLDVPFWNSLDLEKIGHMGFDALNLELDRAAVEHFAKEAAGSPQLMQAICLHACRELEHRNATAERHSVEVTEDARRRIFERTVASTDHRTLVDILMEGPKRRGTERLMFDFKNGEQGDVYHCV